MKNETTTGKGNMTRKQISLKARFKRESIRAQKAWDALHKARARWYDIEEKCRNAGVDLRNEFGTFTEFNDLGA